MKQKSILKVFKEHNVEFTTHNGTTYVEVDGLAKVLGVTRMVDGVEYPRTKRFLDMCKHNDIHQVKLSRGSYISLDDAIECAMLIRNDVGKEFRKSLVDVVLNIDSNGLYIEDTRKAAEFCCETILGHKRTDKCWEREVELLVRNIELNSKIQELESKNATLTNILTDCINNKDCHITSEVVDYYCTDVLGFDKTDERYNLVFDVCMRAAELPKIKKEHDALLSVLESIKEQSSKPLF